MSIDRDVMFLRRGGRATRASRKDVRLRMPPTRRQLDCLLVDFLGGAAPNIIVGVTPWVVTLPGINTFPLHRVLKSASARLRQRAQQETPDRQFEIYLDLPESITVTTRQADEFTGVIADGFVALVKRTWRTR